MPNVTAAENELAAIAAVLGEAGKGVMQVISDLDEPVGDFGLLRRLVERSGRPLSLSLMQTSKAPARWSQILGLIEQANAEGLPIKGQVIGRPIGLMMGLAISRNPFSLCPSYQAIAHLDLPARLRALREAEFRARVLQEYRVAMEAGASSIQPWLDSIYPMSDPPDYEPRPQDSLAARARAKGLEPVEYAYDLLIENDGTAIFYNPSVNYSNNSIAAAETMIRHPDTLYGLGDGGAHMGMICDASASTYMLTRWGTGPDAIPLATVVKGLSADNAAAMGLHDRGIIAKGYRADLNLIDLGRLALRRPHVVHDLPCGRSRLDQRAEGYVATFVGGQATYRDGVATEALPGRLVRGGQGAP
jgi:N-acyl-D-aspartate/D-glutamate deacylase